MRTLQLLIITHYLQIYNVYIYIVYILINEDGQ